MTQKAGTIIRSNSHGTTWFRMVPTGNFVAANDTETVKFTVFSTATCIDTPHADHRAQPTARLADML